MSDLKTYIIPLNGVLADDKDGLTALFKAHAKLFDNATLSSYGGDSRYAVVDDSFAVTNLVDGKLKYLCQIHYFVPCHDQHDFFQAEGNADYHIVNDEVHLKLDETLWNVC